MEAHEGQHTERGAESALSTVDRADVACASSDYRSAATLYRSALSDANGLPPADLVVTQRKLAECLVKLGDTVEALSVLKLNGVKIDQKKAND